MEEPARRWGKEARRHVNSSMAPGLAPASSATSLLRAIHQPFVSAGPPFGALCNGEAAVYASVPECVFRFGPGGEDYYYSRWKTGLGIMHVHGLSTSSLDALKINNAPSLASLLYACKYIPPFTL